MTYTADQIRAAFSARGVHPDAIEAAIEHMDQMRERECHNMIDDYILYRKKRMGREMLAKRKKYVPRKN